MYYKNGEKRFGQRPNEVEYEGDLLLFVKKGATSFHISEERWKEVMKLKEVKREKELNELRLGWDLIFDIDAPNLVLSKIIAKEIIDFLKDKQIDFLLKYSGNKGFHIIIPWEEFPKEVEYDGKKIELRKAFPDIPRLILAYIYSKIEKKLVRKLDKIVENILGISGENFKEQLIIDSILLSSRHLFRAPYSLHEKTWRASIFIK